MAEGSPVEIVARGPVACGSMLWRARGSLRVTFVVKATFGLVNEGVARLVAPVPVVYKDRHRDKDATKGIEAAVDVAPYLDGAGLTLVGHAYAPSGRTVPALSVRLAVGRERPLIDKTLHVFGDRSASAGVPEPFSRMPLVYERAYGGEGVRDNPIGVGAEGAKRFPNVVHPADSKRPAGFGPIASVWPVRRGLLTAEMQRAVRDPVIEIGDEFPWQYFETAPADQRLPYLVGDEWIAIDGMHPSLARVSTRLPMARGEVRVHVVGPDGVSPPHALELVADTLIIDADQQRCSVIWRGHAELPEGESGLAQLRVFGAVALPGYPISWPSIEEVRAMAPPIVAEPTSALPLGETVTSVLVASDVKPSVPFVAVPRRSDATSVLSLKELEAQRNRATPFESASRGAGLPFLPSSPSAPREPSVVDDSTSTLDHAGLELQARRSAMPFEGPPSSTPPVTLDPRSLAQQDEGETQMISAAELEQRAKARDAAPFRIARPGEGARGPSTPLPGAPWSPPVLDAPAPPPEVAAPPFDFPPPLPPPAPLLQSLPSLVGSEPEAARFFHSLPRADSDEEATAVGARSEGLPARTSEVAKIVLDGSMQAALVPWQIRPPEDSLTIVVKGSFELVADEPARWLDESTFPIGDLYLDDDDQKSLLHASDFPAMKARADVTAIGKAYAPGGSSQAMVVSFRFGARGSGFERTLNVFGDRQWKKSVIALAPTDPALFSSMPLVYERAFGGLGFDANPVGTGHKAATGPHGVARLPNLETPGRLVTSPGDAPPPACFAPIPPLWKERWSRLGTYDKRWFKTRWPYFPEDFDLGFFQSAPASQQLAFLRGDESFEFVGMRPDRPLFKGRLPGVVARAFVQKTDEAGGGFVEVLLELDTAAFDLESLTLDLVWRGMITVSDEDAPEILNVFVSSDRLGAPQTSLAEMRGRYLARVVPKPVIEEDPAAPVRDNDVEDAIPPDEDGELDAALDAAAEKGRAARSAAGIDDPSEMPLDSPNPTELIASMRRAGASEEDVAALEALITDEAEAAPPEPAKAPIREEVVRRHRAGEAMAGLDLMGADLTDLDLRGANFAAAVLKDANMSRARLDGASFVGATVANVDLAGAVLIDADLSGADFAGAKLGDADLSGAKVAGADFSEVTALAAVFARVRGEGAIFVGGHFERGSFEGAEIPSADFSRATLDGVVFRGAKLSAARFYDAVGDRVVFDRAEMRDARVEGVRFPRSSFKEIDAPGSVWEKALLDEAVFDAANLAGAGFLRASCRKATFVGANLSEARMRRTKLTGANLARANLMNAVLERADLSIADFRGANLHGVGLWKAQLLETKLDRAIVTQSSLARRPS